MNDLVELARGRDPRDAGIMIDDCTEEAVSCFQAVLFALENCNTEEAVKAAETGMTYLKFLQGFQLAQIRGWGRTGGKE